MVEQTATSGIEEKLYVELPRDEYGNRGFKAAVVQGHITQDDAGYRTLNITTPGDYPWKGVSADCFAEVSMDAGPPRYLKSKNDIDPILEQHKVG